MRLTFITGTPSNVHQGSGTFVGIDVLRRTLENQGHSVSLITPASPRAPLGLTAWRLGFNVALALRYRRRADVTVGFDMDGFLVPLPSASPYLVSIKGVLADELTFEKGIVRRLLALQAWCEARNARRAGLLVTTSRYAADRVRGHYGVAAGRIRHVPELIDLQAWRAELSERPANATSEVPFLLTVAHMYPRKSLDDLIRATAMLPGRWRDVHLHVVGIGPERERWQALAKELGIANRVAFLGHVSRRRLAAEYRGCTLFCLPSRQEGFGIVFLEAMAAGKAIVACHASAVPEVVPDGVAGILIAPGQPRELAEALTSLLDDPHRRAALGQGGWHTVERFNAPRVAKRFLEVAQEVMGT